MKISATQRHYIGTAGILLCAAAVAVLGNKCEHKIINDLKEEVYAKDSLRYKEIEGKTANMNLIDEKNTWARELVRINDSLNAESAAQKAYFEGGQAVRDSLKYVKK